MKEMKKLIVHIEYDENEVPVEHLKDRLEFGFETITDDHGGDFGYRFFGTLEEAMAWEKGKGFPEGGTE